ncbi:hypothetical protein FJW08_22760 [Mesorhizobium sp. B3-2-1]|uniref:hypothetical protein n=1 Tax=unclassified Mesorhizobium TaxID=325217 RepID=UPI00112A284B|nr:MULTISPECIES: hypothetical protein [unclassified Mesorhizobium]MBZ9671803.1 hypothetical protein [Mesorhizobium sp. ES1-3]TPI27789.1 hypothetical protein FJW08_22760 [Mesorhizobium sp. B3-2-1]
MEQAVIVYLLLSDGQFGTPQERETIIALEQRLEQAVGNASAGEFDGDEFGGGKCVLYMYGPDAERLFAVIEPVLKSSPAATGGYAIKRFGKAANPNAKEARVSW